MGEVRSMAQKNYRGEIASKNELKSFLREGDTENFSPYEIIFDRGHQSAPLSRYGDFLPSIGWVEEFVKSGGSFDSCGVWGINPFFGVEMEEWGVCPQFSGKMLALLGRADYDYNAIVAVWEKKFHPQTRAEFHAVVRGIQRKQLADKAGCHPSKSLMTLGWMTEPRWARYICKTSTRVGAGFTNYTHFNGVYAEALLNGQCLENPTFASWVSKRPSPEVMACRPYQNRPALRAVGQISNLPKNLYGAAMRHKKEYRQRLESVGTGSSGYLLVDATGEPICHDWQQGYKKISHRRVREDMSAMKIGEMWFLWDPNFGSQRHIENPSFREGLKFWEKRTRKGEPRPLCLNDVRNDIIETAGFCLAGTKAFLQNRMPFLYRLISQYNSWDQIPAEIMSTTWFVDFKIFQGYPIP